MPPHRVGRQIKHLGEALARNGHRISRPRRARARLIALEYDPTADNVGDED